MTLKMKNARRLRTSIMVVVVTTFLGISGLGHKQAHAQSSSESLVGTVWVSEEEHTRVAVSPDGEHAFKTGKNIYFRFVSQTDEIYLFELRWWNEAERINVLEHGVAVEIAPGVIQYIEADPMQDDGGSSLFPGIAGHGYVTLLGDGKAKIIQFGHLEDGTAAAFSSILAKSDNVPDISVPQTYP